MILRTCRFTHEHYFRREEIDACPDCNNPMTLTHFIMLCPVIENHRKEMKQYCENKGIPFCMQNILNCEFPKKILLNYVLKTNYSRKI